MDSDAQEHKVISAADMPESVGKEPVKVFYDFEKKPFLIILDRDLRRAAEMVTDKDVKCYIRNCLRLLIYVIMKRNGIPLSKNVYEQIMKQRKDIILKVFDGLAEKFIPKRPPLGKAVEQKFAKLCMEHYELIIRFAEALFDEHVERFRKRHREEPVLEWIKGHKPTLASAGNGYEPTYSMKTIPFKYRDPSGDYYVSARRFYAHLHQDPAKDYKFRSPPDFLMYMCRANQMD